MVIDVKYMKKKIWDYFIMAKRISFALLPRRKKKVIGIVIHNTGNTGDSAWGNCHYFGSDGDNIRQAGAHFFIDQNGYIGRSIPMNRSAYAVGNPKGSYAPGPYYSTLNNNNTVSIELCDIMIKEPSEEMLVSLDRLVKYIKKYCPNVKYIVRHWDIVRKECPERYIKTAENEKAWTKLHARLMKDIAA